MPLHSRKSPRLAGYDYRTENYYFITICTHDKKCIFGTVEKLNELGQIAKRHIEKIGDHYDHIHIDNFKIMPNHIHMILVIGAESKDNAVSVVGQYKSGVSREIHKIAPACKVWQRSFHDRVIRNQKEYEKIWQYIQYNEQKWATDCFYSEYHAEKIIDM